MNDKDINIVTQVAYKEAALDARKSGIDVTTDEGLLLLVQLTEAHASVLVAEINRQVAGLRGSQTVAPAPVAASVAAAPAAASFDAEASMTAAFGAESAPAEIYVKNGLHENTPLPAWLFEKLAAVGETEVYDNRGEIAGTRKPHFRAVNVKDDSDRPLGFWPPK